jgi:hypothetical protein
MEAREFKDEFIKINTELESLIDKVTLSAEQRKVYEPKAISLINCALEGENKSEMIGIIAYKLWQGSLSSIFLNRTVKHYNALAGMTNKLIEMFNKSAEFINNYAAMTEENKHSMNRLMLEHQQEITKIRSTFAKAGIAARLENDLKQMDKAFVKGCWNEWQIKPENYASKSAFSTDMLSKCEHLKSKEVIARSL